MEAIASGGERRAGAAARRRHVRGAAGRHSSKDARAHPPSRRVPYSSVTSSCCSSDRRRPPPSAGGINGKERAPGHGGARGRRRRARGRSGCAPRCGALGLRGRRERLVAHQRRLRLGTAEGAADAPQSEEARTRAPTTSDGHGAPRPAPESARRCDSTGGRARARHRRERDVGAVGNGAALGVARRPTGRNTRRRVAPHVAEASDHLRRHLGREICGTFRCMVVHLDREVALLRARKLSCARRCCRLGASRGRGRRRCPSFQHASAGWYASHRSSAAHEPRLIFTPPRRERRRRASVSPSSAASARPAGRGHERPPRGPGEDTEGAPPPPRPRSTGRAPPRSMCAARRQIQMRSMLAEAANRRGDGERSLFSPVLPDESLACRDQDYKSPAAPFWLYQRRDAGFSARQAPPPNRRRATTQVSAPGRSLATLRQP